MKQPKASLLLHPVFIVSLLILLCNDFYWKQVYSNWLTGKLSDFAGIIVLMVFLQVLFPTVLQMKVAVATALSFLWWKSPLSQPLISFCNNVLHLPVARVIDYSDLTALVMTIPATCLKLKRANLSYPGVYLLRWCVGAITFFSLCATSMPYRSLFQAHPNSRDIYFDESFSSRISAVDLLQHLTAKGINFRRDSVMYYPVTNQQSLYYRQVQTNDSIINWQQLSQAKDSMLYLKWEGRPYYIIPSYRLEIENTVYTFKNIRFTLKENDKKTKTRITVQMFEGGSAPQWGFTSGKEKNFYKKIFEGVFLNN